MESNLYQLKLHTSLNDFKTVDIDFGQSLYDFFRSRKEKNDNKQVRFSFSDNLDEEPHHIDIASDPEAREFMVPDCLKIMQLVPLQIASNAYKYMPDHSWLEVELKLSGNRKYFSFKNLGPQTENEETEHIYDAGVRGVNTDGIRGQGLGLSQVKEILQLHKDWLHPLISVSSDDEKLLFNKIPYSLFTLTLSFLRNGDANGDINSENVLTGFEAVLPQILFHNCFEIYESIYDIIKKLKTTNERGLDNWKSNINLMGLYMNEFKHDLIIGEYIVDRDIDALLEGYDVMVAPRNTIKMACDMLNEYFYPDLTIDHRGKMRQSKRAGNTFYQLIHSLLDNIFNSAPKGSSIIVEYFEGMIVCHFDDEIEFLKYPLIPEILNNDPYYPIEQDKIHQTLPSIYALMLDKWGYELKFEAKKLCLIF
ncbi:MAG: sensor histidine kinase [Bacteroides sp.]|nr:sensor histidine kinase [Bacteroides sp.]